VKPVVFISHIHSEANIAVWLKEKTSDLLLDGIEFFVSSDRQSIVGGDRWLSKIEEAIGRAAMVLVLCTKDSVLRPWVNFEAGGAWMAKKRVVPVCYGDLKPSDLPEPLRSLQGYSVHNPTDMHDLVALLARVAELRTPNFDSAEFSRSAPTLQSLQSAAVLDLPLSGELKAEQRRAVSLELGSSVRRDWIDARVRNSLDSLEAADLDDLDSPEAAGLDDLELLDPPLSAEEKFAVVNGLVAQSRRSREDEGKFLAIFDFTSGLSNHFEHGLEGRGIYSKEHGDVLLDRVLELCNSQNSEVRVAASQALRSFGGRYGIPASEKQFGRIAETLIRLSEDKSPSVVRGALPAIGDLAFDLPGQYHERIRQIVEDSITVANSEVRAAGTWTLGHLMPMYEDEGGGLKLVQLVMKQLRDRNTSVVDTAIIALENLTWSADSAIGEVEEELYERLVDIAKTADGTRLERVGEVLERMGRAMPDPPLERYRELKRERERMEREARRDTANHRD
jgi:TIR domain